VLEEARLDGAELGDALLTGASFFGAHLDKADLTGGVQAQGANFSAASMQGADLSGAHLQRANFSSASMQGAVLSLAQLQGAILREADLEGADLYQAKLHGADMTGAKIRAADLRSAGVWMTLPPAQDAMALSDFSDLVIRPMDEPDVATLAGAIERVAAGPSRDQIKGTLDPVMQVAASRKWAGSIELLRWESMVKASAAAIGEGYKGQLTDYLGRLMCKSRWNNGAVATGVGRRAQAQQFRGDLLVINDRTRASDCPGGQKALPRVLRDLNQAADIARSN
jgi:hypothetical protein